MSLSDYSFSEFPEGDPGTFVIRDAYTKSSQMKLLCEHLGVSMDFAEELFGNGVILMPKGPLADMKLLEMDPPTELRNAYLRDSRYLRGVTWTKNDDGSVTFGTLVDEERSVFSEIRKQLCEIADEREQGLSDHIPVWYVDSNANLSAVLDRIAPLLDHTRSGPHQLWFRGQNKEYRITTRSKNVQEWLGYPIKDLGEISLLPSLARETQKNIASATWAWAYGGPAHYWEKACLIWGLLRHPEWFNPKKEYIPYIRQILETDDEHQMSELLRRIRYDIDVYAEADDFRQWFFAFHKFKTFPLILQHYGMPTSTLDLTADVETALFFAVHEFDSRNGSFTKSKPGAATPVIYLFAEALMYAGSGETCIRSSEHIMRFGGPEPLPIPERISRQKCGLLYGASMYGYNYYSDLLIGKIVLHNHENFTTSVDAKFLFPNQTKDDLYNALLRCRPKLEYLVEYQC